MSATARSAICWQIPTQPVAHAADIVCGPGNSTQLLAEYYANATIIGIDNSPEMIEAARKRLPHIQFAVEEITIWHNPSSFDLIFANAVLQWLPNHSSLLALLAKLSPGGTLAVQIPDNFDEPSHQLMRQTTDQGPWAAKLAKALQEKRAVIMPIGITTCSASTVHNSISGVPPTIIRFPAARTR